MNALIEMAVSLVGTAVIITPVMAYIMYADAIIDSTVDAIESFLYPPTKPAPTTHGELIALYGEAVDG